MFAFKDMNDSNEPVREFTRRIIQEKTFQLDPGVHQGGSVGRAPARRVGAPGSSPGPDGNLSLNWQK